MATSFRQLDTNEMALLEKLLGREFPGWDALRLQPSSVSGTQIDEDSSLELRYEGSNLAETSRGARRRKPV
jgi:hypothetical protein